MAFPRVGGPGVPLDLSDSLAYWGFQTLGKGNQGGGFNTVSLQAGEVWLVPPGTFHILPGPYTFLQFRDPITNLFRNLETQPGVPMVVGSDGFNWRLANLTGCMVGAVLTNNGSGYTSAPTVTGNQGSPVITPVVGGALTFAVGTAGAGYNFPPQVIVGAPPPGGVQASVTVSLSAGALNAVTVVNNGAGYLTAPPVLIVPDARDTGPTTAGTITATVAGAQTITALEVTGHGSPQTSVSTIAFSGGGGSSAAATAVMCFAATGFSVTGGGVAYGNAQPFAILTTGGLVPPGGATYNNPTICNGLFIPRQALINGTSTAGGAIQTAGSVIVDAGLLAAVPFAAVVSEGNSTPTTIAQVAITVGGITDTSLIQPI